MHYHRPEPQVHPYPHQRECDVKQGKADTCSPTTCSKCATGAFNYLTDKNDEYDLEMGLAGAQK